MGLKSDIYNVFYETLSDAGGESIELSSFQEKKVDKLASGLTDAIVDFIQKQEFQITEMRATVDIEEIKTSGPYQADLNPSTTFGGYPITSPPGGFTAVNMPSVFLSKTRGQGGMMTAKAKSYIGPKSAKNRYGDTNNEALTKVKLLKVKDR